MVRPRRFSKKPQVGELRRRPDESEPLTEPNHSWLFRRSGNDMRPARRPQRGMRPTVACDSLPRMVDESAFDGPALVAALDAYRVESGLEWPAVADALAQQSSDLRAALNDHGVCSGALVRTVKRGSMSCQYAV